MAKIKDLFNIENAKSKGYEHYEEGNIPFVTNGDYDNSIVGFVKPLEKDRVFEKASICLSSFCEATIQTPPFLPRGNGGSGLVVLVPKKEMTEEELYFYTAQINMMKWKFSFSRMLIGRRIQDLELVTYKNIKIKIKEKINQFLPKEKPKQIIQENKNIEVMKVKDLCYIEKKTAPPQNNITLNGNVPYVSSSSQNNGVVLLVDEEPNFKAGSLTIAKDGNDGTSFYQPFDYLTSLHNYVLTPKNNMPKWFLLYIGAIIKIKCYGYNHYYPLSKKHLERMGIEIPMENGKMDLDYIEKIVKNSYGYEEVKQYL
ncbi:restriction endonuclease subunit S [Candidatus Pacearchaeota archaeon]|nr:restriction endonuclease subunit S [Candidatus Pacearchaeota archaeon]